MAQDNSASLSLQTLARALGGEVSGGQVLAPGPGHSPTDRSMSVKLDASAPGGFLIYSFAGDDVNACRDHVRETVGLAPFKPNGRKQVTDDDITRALTAAMETQTRPAKRGVLIVSYNYTDEHGGLLYQVQRFEPKSFAVRRPDGNGKWTPGIGERRVLYRWLDLCNIPDGQFSFAKAKKMPTTWPSGGSARHARPEASGLTEMVQALAGRNILIMQDNDDCRRKESARRGSRLHGVAASVRVVLLPGLPERGDVSDWLDANRRNPEKLIELCFDVPVWEPDESAEPSGVSTKQGTARITRWQPFLRLGSRPWTSKRVKTRCRSSRS